MKKILLFLLAFLCLGTVKAAEVSRLDLIYEDYSVGEISFIDKEDNSYYLYGKKGIFHFYNKATNYVKKYDIKGDFYDYIVDDDVIYIFETFDGYMEFKLINKEFEELKSVTLNIDGISFYEERDDGYLFFGSQGDKIVYIKLDKDFNITDFKSYPIIFWVNGIKRNKDTFYFRTGSLSNCYMYDVDFKDITCNEYQNADAEFVPFLLSASTTYSNYDEDANVVSEELYERIVNKEQLQHNNTVMNAQVTLDGDNYVVLYQESEDTGTSSDNVIFYGFKLVYFDKNLNEKWRVEFPDIQTEINTCSNFIEKNTIITSSDGNIILFSNYQDEQLFNVYNREGQLVGQYEEKIKSNADYSPIYADFKGENLFVIYQTRVNICEGKSQGTSILPTFLSYTINDLLSHPLSSVYYFGIKYQIETKVTGKGQIKIDSSIATSGEEVVFELIPDDGYVLNEVKVTDAEGNVVVFNDYTFTMPSADVLIEAEFVYGAVNPNTNDIAITVLTLITMATGALVLVQRKKINELK